MTDSTLRFTKGHGTENDFVLVPDPDGRLDLTPGQVAAVCDRRAGLGGDGLIRVVRCAAVTGEPAVSAQAGPAEWFMDYRNSDGSVAEMCGNGVRVFARYLVDAGLAPSGELTVATRGGPKRVRLEAAGDVTVEMGQARLPEPSQVTVAVGQRCWPARNVDLGNPHAVAFVKDLADAGDLRAAPLVTPAGAYPAGVNVEFVVDRGPGHVAMRVHERGVGETRSCGTGTCAVLASVALRDGRASVADGVAVATEAAGAAYTVDVPGGRLRLWLGPEGQVEMAGPAVLLASGEIDLAALRPDR